MGKMTATDKVALNYLYKCKDIDSTVLVEFMREENKRVDKQLKMMMDQTVTNEEMTKAKESTERSLDAKDRTIAALKEEVSLLREEANQDIEILKSKLASQEAKMTDMLDRMTRLEAELGIRRSPVAFQCGWRRNDWTEDNSTITFDRLTISSLSGVGGGLDTYTGVFTAGFSGIWSVTFTVRSFKPKTEANNTVWLDLNGEKVEETLLLTYYLGPEGYVGSQESRTIYLQLDKGDEVSLKTGEVYSLSYITLCFELAHFEYN